MFGSIFNDIFVTNMNSQHPEINNIPSQPESLAATIGELDGEIDLQWDSVKGASSYVVELLKGKRGNWEQVDIVSVSRYTVNSLRNKIVYSFRIAALNGRRQGPWSKIITKKL